MPNHRNTPETFWTRTKPMDDGCIVWTGFTRKAGYGSLTFTALQGNETPLDAHRVAWALERNHGRLNPPGTHLHHECRNPVCVNPDHLTLLDAAAHNRLHKSLTQ